MRGKVFAPVFAVAVAALAAASCAQEEYPAWLWDAQHASANAADASVSGPVACSPARAEPLPARLVARGARDGGASGPVVLVPDLFQRFTAVCGACHGASVEPPGQGGFQIRSAADFTSAMNASVLAHVTSNVGCPHSPDPTNALDPMPPCSSPNGMSFSARSPNDPVRQMADLVQAWLDAGKPASFSAPGTSSAGGAAAAFALPADRGDAMTNIGNCIPTRAMIGTEAQKSADLDAMFSTLAPRPDGTAAQQIGLPEHLADTDLFTFDSEALAPYGVLAYAPAYPLWSDDAGKIRHLRVPRGASIRFQEESQAFEIPPNTRFYKTFLKKVVDDDGSYRWRKIETRLIVSRPDRVAADGSATTTALFGTYKWNEDETDAVLVTTPLNDGTPFADTELLYHVDQPLAQAVLAASPAAPEEALLEARAARHYAIPSSRRCQQCHMGSPNQSFILGFTPLQIARRAKGQGGVIEDTGPDEQSQLQRFIEAGVVSGLASPREVAPLERSQAGRPPRNDHELVAQGYMLGNCAHCHNPRGFPSVQNPVLADTLNLLPSKTGGIFQFPLERFSPRIERGTTGSTPIPYITPSLVDLPRMDRRNPETQGGDVFLQGTGPESVSLIVYAPWRSLIYRVVDSAFAYTDDLALIPHMPMNTAGYDPRAKQIFADWMVSIPAARKHPEWVEYAYQTDGDPADNLGNAQVDDSPQPYAEIAADDPRMPDALAAAAGRLAVLQSGKNPAVKLAPAAASYSRYADPGQTDDILDPAVLSDPICHPTPAGNFASSHYPFAEHPHWVVTDLTEPPGAWAPRQSNWSTVLVEQKIPPETATCDSPAGDHAAYVDQRDAVALLQSATLDEVRDYATRPLPFGMWDAKSGCRFGGVPNAGSLSGASRPRWLDVVAPPSEAKVYVETPGAAIFKMICINCHGPRGDADGRMAQNLATMTGGLARVADFRNGLFGPVGAAEEQSHRHAVFGSLPASAPASWTGVSDDDRAARYMAWMALGGTPTRVPEAILEIVGTTKVFQEHRVLPSSQVSANMLSSAKALCQSLLGPHAYEGTGFDPARGYLAAAENARGVVTPTANWSLLARNGDAELWLRLCTIANPPPVHVVDVKAGQLSIRLAYDPSSQLFAVAENHAVVPASAYPRDAPVGNDRGGVDATLTDGNAWPWCVAVSGPDDDRLVRARGLPACPASLMTSSAWMSDEDANRWAVRGAINAGFSVYLYLQSIEGSAPAPDFDHCELLP